MASLCWLSFSVGQVAGKGRDKFHYQNNVSGGFVQAVKVAGCCRSSPRLVCLASGNNRPIWVERGSAWASHFLFVKLVPCSCEKGGVVWFCLIEHWIWWSVGKTSLFVLLKIKNKMQSHAWLRNWLYAAVPLEAESPHLFQLTAIWHVAVTKERRRGKISFIKILISHLKIKASQDVGRLLRSDVGVVHRDWLLDNQRVETVAPEKAVVLQSADSSLFWGSIHLKVVCQTSTHLRCPFCSHKALLLVMSTMPPRHTHSLLWSLLCCGQMCLLHWQPAHPPRWEMMSLHKLIFPGGRWILPCLQPIRGLFTPESPGTETNRHTFLRGSVVICWSHLTEKVKLVSNASHHSSSFHLYSAEENPNITAHQWNGSISIYWFDLSCVFFPSISFLSLFLYWQQLPMPTSFSFSLTCHEDAEWKKGRSIFMYTCFQCVSVCVAQ